MSDPVTNVEIEDVLSSIRRLVSENAKASSPEALILQQSDRVGSSNGAGGGAPKVQAATPGSIVQEKPRVLSRNSADLRKEPVLSRALNASTIEDAQPSDLPPMPSVEEPVDPILEEAVIEAVETKALEETISTIEASVAGQDADWEPDDVFLNDNDPQDPEISGADPDPAAAVDLEALREIVVETIREELRGALGEKITRNVRKLVRREIQRAITSKDLG